MRLSDAILLGDSLKGRNGDSFNASRTGGCGCAIAGARRAAGIEDSVASPTYSEPFMKMWPWVDDGVLVEISSRYYDLIDGRTTIEKIADYVRSIEPADSPESVTNPQETNSETLLAH